MAGPAPRHRWLKPAAFLALSLPWLWLIWQWALALQGLPHDLGVDPIQATIRFLGDTAIRALLIALAVTPLAKLTGWKRVMQLRRMAGLYAFAYAALHLAAYFGMDQLFSLSALWADVLKRKYITVGMAAFVLLIPLAVTSTHKMARRIGARNWQRLHRLVYLIGILAVIHHAMMVKGNQIAPWAHGAILAVLLGYRLAGYARRKLKTRAAAA